MFSNVSRPRSVHLRQVATGRLLRPLLATGCAWSRRRGLGLPKWHGTIPRVLSRFRQTATQLTGGLEHPVKHGGRGGGCDVRNTNGLGLAHRAEELDESHAEVSCCRYGDGRVRCGRGRY